MDQEQQSKLKLQEFLAKHEKSLSKEIKALSQNDKHNKIKAKILSPHSQQDFHSASQHLKQGGLVAFPTETVYGLGANALNKQALLNIYKTKKRPLTDPIIVHIYDPSDALKYVQMTNNEAHYFKLLSEKFWPGPLTIILKANLSVLPSVVTAQTGFVGIRCPSHPYFRKLLKDSQLPIGAPSANLFSHVSPTQSVHVFNDFYTDDVWIVDGNRCQFGIESTVVKVLENKILVFREGSLSVSKIQQFIFQQLGKDAPSIQLVKKTADQKQSTQAPGQLLKHYSPYLPCYFVTNPETIQSLSWNIVKNLGVISFSQKLYGRFSQIVNTYYEVGQNFDVKSEVQVEFKLEQDEQKYCTKQQKIKMREFYHLLRLLENADISMIIICWEGPKTGTIWDKIFRSTQGKQYVVKFQ